VFPLRHVFLECDHYDTHIQRYFNAPTLKELFDTVNARNILGLIRDIWLHHLI